MQDSKVQNDRFYKEEVKEMLEFAPEPMHMMEASHKGKFTIGNKYPILERKDGSTFSCGGRFGAYFGSTYKIKTTDDKGAELWIDDKYFIPADQSLTFNNIFHHDPEKEDLLDGWCGELDIDIRKVATEKCVSKEIPLDDGLKLAGLASDPEDEDFEEDDGYDDNIYSARDFSWCMKRSLYEGVVKDNGNAMMFDGAKCQEAIQRVFGPKNPEETGDIIDSIREMVSNHSLVWDDGLLCIDNAKTKISFSDVSKAYCGLKSLMSPKVAEKLVSKIVAKKINKVF